MGDGLAVLASVLGTDAWDGEAVGRVVLDMAPALANGIASLIGGRPAGEVTGQISTAIFQRIDDSWAEDVLASHLNVLRRDEDWGVGRPPVDVTEPPPGAPAAQGVGSVNFKYRIERIDIPDDFSVRVTLNTVDTTVRHDDFDSNDAYVASRAWNGRFTGTALQQTQLRIPERGVRRMSPGEPWGLNREIFSGAIGPFLSLDLAVWDEDDHGDDDMLGSYIALWFTPQLMQAFRDNAGRPLQFRRVMRGSAWIASIRRRSLALVSRPFGSVVQ
jgi:hypothetical protein